MHIDRVTLTGIDDFTDTSRLVELSTRFPFVEFGVLFSSVTGRARYPHPEKISEFTEKLGSLSAHFCGWYPREVLEKKNYSLLTKTGVDFDRIQLNYTFGKEKQQLFLSLIDWLEDNRHVTVIIQKNHINAEVLWNCQKRLEGLDNFHVLYDASGGNGVEIEKIEAPFFKHYTGYAGGIDVYNIREICKLITKAEWDESWDVWIDMESGVRTDNKFDLRKAELVLEYVDNLNKASV